MSCEKCRFWVKNAQQEAIYPEAKRKSFLFFTWLSEPDWFEYHWYESTKESNESGVCHYDPQRVYTRLDHWCSHFEEMRGAE